MDDILPIVPQNLPYNLDDKIFYNTDDEGNIIGDKYSYNDQIKWLENISGVSKEFLGPKDE